MSDAITPFAIETSDDELSDLRRRLQATRWPDPEPVDDWSQGIPLSYLQEVCAYWAEKYDWRAREARLNAFAQFRTTLDGVGIHFIHVRSPEQRALPLVMTHGWPGTVWEMLPAVKALATRRRTAAVQPTRSTSSCRRFPASAFPVSRPRGPTSRAPVISGSR